MTPRQDDPNGTDPGQPAKTTVDAALIRLGTRGTSLGPSSHRHSGRRVIDVKPMAAALAGALLSGGAMYAVGAHAQDDRFGGSPAFVEPVDSQTAFARPAVNYY